MAGKAPPRRTIMQMVKNGGNNDPPLRWSDIPDVREHPNFKNKNVAMIDAKFEIIFQEAYFNFRIRTLLVAFFSSGKVKETDRKAIFSSIEKVLRFSDVFLADLEQCWQRDIFLTNVFDVIRKHEGNFDVYAKHGAALKSTLQHLAKLKAEKKEFVAVIETWRLCAENIYNLDLETFLSLPQDRIMSVIMAAESAALLVDKTDPEYKSSQAAMKALRKISAKCNVPAARADVRPTTPVKAPEPKPETLYDKLVFADGVAKFPVEAPGRQVVLMEEVTLVRHTGIPVTKWSPRHLILFNDILLVTAKLARKEERYMIEDHCHLTQLEVKNTEDFLALMPDPSLTEIQEKLLLIKLKQNHENKAVLMLFGCVQIANRVSWQNLLLMQPMSAQHPATASAPEDHEQDEFNELLPQINRTSQDDKIIAELKLKQNARKKMNDWNAPPEAVQYNNDGLHRPVTAIPHELGVGVDVGVKRSASNVGDSRGVAALDGGEGNGMERTINQIPRASYTQQPQSTPTTPKKMLPPPEESPRKESGLEAINSYDRMLDYPPGMMVFPLVSAVRWIVKQGEIVQRWQLADGKMTEGKTPMTMTLFNDVLFFTVQKKNEARLKVMSYGMRNLVDLTLVHRVQNMPSKYLTDSNDRFMFMVHLLENHKRKEEIMVVSVSSENEREGWLKAIPTPPPGDDVADRVFDPWDSPLVLVTQPYKAAGPTQLHLSLNEKLHVRRRRADGWCEGERVSDGEKGLFPGHCTTEVDSPHKYAKSVRRRLQARS